MSFAHAVLAAVLALAVQNGVSAFAAPSMFAPRSKRLPQAGNVAPLLHSRHSCARMQGPATDETGAAMAAEPPAAAAEVSDAVLGLNLPKPTEAQLKQLLDKSSSAAMATTWRRAAFWEPGKASLLEIVNVLGRFDSCSEWITRTEFVELEKSEERAEDERNALTYKRHEMALRMKCGERAALWQNAPTMPFRNEALAASVGLTVEDFQDLPVSKDACEVLYDALAESRSTLIPYTVLDSRIKAMVGSGAFDETAFRFGHAKSTIIFIIGLFFFGKANFLWILVGVKLLHDWRPDVIPGPKELGLFKIWGVI